MINVAKWEFNARCNLKCPYCVASGEQRELSPEKKRCVIDKMYEIGITTIDFFGKEPLINEEIFDLVDYAESKYPGHFDYMLITNGINLDQYWRKIVSRPFSRITVSMSGETGRPYMPDLDVVEEFIKHSVPVQVSFDVIRQNKDHIHDYYHTFEDKGVSSVYIKPIRAWGELTEVTHDVYAVRDEDYLDAVRKLIDHDPDVFTIVDVPWQFPKTMKYFKGREYENVVFDMDEHCQAGENIVFISSDGRAYGCGYVHYAGLDCYCDFLTDYDPARLLTDGSKQCCGGECHGNKVT